VVLAEFGLHLPEEVEVNVWDASSEARSMVVLGVRRAARTAPSRRSALW
jgi:hypothetical protein